MAYGTAYQVADRDEKLAAMDSFLDRFFPGRSKLVRPPNEQEIKATTFVGMAIEQASGKIRNERVHDEEEDYAVPAWTAEFPVRTVLGEIQECPRQLPGISKPEDMQGWVPGRSMDEIFLDSYRRLYKED
jgi:hypothetical protein